MTDAIVVSATAETAASIAKAMQLIDDLIDIACCDATEDECHKACIEHLAQVIRDIERQQRERCAQIVMTEAPLNREAIAQAVLRDGKSRSKRRAMTCPKLPDGSSFFVAEISTEPQPEGPEFQWNPWNKVVQSIKDGMIDEAATAVERTKRGLPPWTAELAETEPYEAPIP